MADAIALFVPGDMLAGRFRIAREVARGGVGVVYEARDERPGRRIAIKAANSGGTPGYMGPDLAAEPASPRPWVGAAEAEWRQYELESTGDWLTRCGESFRRAEPRGMDSPGGRRDAALLDAKDGRISQSIRRCVRATELPSKNPAAWRRLGDASRLNHRQDLGLNVLHKVEARRC